MKKQFFFLFFCVLALSSFLFVNAQSSDVTLIVSTDKQAYYGFGAVSISGTLQYNGNPADDGLVGLQVQGSDGSTLVLRAIRTGTSNPSLLQAKIVSAYLSDASGKQQTSIQVGALGYFTIILSNINNTQLSLLVSINIYDSSGVPIGQVYEPCSLTANQTAPATLSLQIPSWARGESAYGYADVFSNLPSKGGVPIGCEQAFEFSITSGQNNVADILSSNSDQGAYNLTFRLPTMGPVDCNYTVYATSLYSGVTAIKSTSFNCQFGDFTHSGSVDPQDLFIFAESYIAYSENNSNYNSICDMNQDGKIDSTDFFLFVNCYITYWSAWQN